MIRIISGSLKGKKLHTIPGKETRPTSDRLRESIYNILSRYPAPETVIDLFAGTGALGIEAMSRGAGFTYFIDSSTRAIRTIKKNVQSCNLEKNTSVVKWDIEKNLNCINTIPQPVDRVFMDPPYNKDLITTTLAHLSHSQMITPHTLVVVEHFSLEPILVDTLPYHLVDERKYGQTMVSFLRRIG